MKGLAHFVRRRQGVSCFSGTEGESSCLGRSDLPPANPGPKREKWLITNNELALLGRLIQVSAMHKIAQKSPITHMPPMLAVLAACEAAARKVPAPHCRFWWSAFDVQWRTNYAFCFENQSLGWTCHGKMQDFRRARSSGLEPPRRSAKRAGAHSMARVNGLPKGETDYDNGNQFDSARNRLRPGERIESLLRNSWRGRTAHSATWRTGFDGNVRGNSSGVNA